MRRRGREHGERHFEMALDLCCLAGAGGRFLHANAAFARLGYTKEELTSRSFLDLVHDDDRASTAAELAKLEEGAATSRFENRLRCKDGSYRWLVWTSCRSSSGAVLSVGRDITRAGVAAEAECKQLHDELDRQKHQYQAIFDTLPQMIWLKDRNNVIIRANAAAAQSIGLRPEEVEGHSTWELYPDHHAAKYHLDDLTVIERGEPLLDIVEPYEQAPGDVRWVRTDKTPYRDEHGNVVGVVVSATDVTGWKRGEEERARLYEQLKRADELKTRFFANASHELRTPLTLILEPVEKLLRRPDLDASAREELEVVRRNARTLLKHVNDLLEIAKMDAGRAPVTHAPVDFDMLLRATAALFESIVRDRKLSLTIESRGPVPGRADPEKVQRVFANVLANAIRFTPDGGVVRCSVRAEPNPCSPSAEDVVIEIADSGFGIDPSMCEAVFERFRQVDETGARARGGTGLGLAIARELVLLHRGTITAGRAPEGGALFTIRLPLEPPASAQTTAAPSASPDAPPRGPVTAETAAPESRSPPDGTLEVVEQLRAETARPRDSVGAASRKDDDRALVLVVEDNPEMNRFLAHELSEDYRVVSALDGQEALRVARETKPDVIVSDVMMPGLDGVSLLKRLRADGELAEVPVILLTARTDEDTLLSALGGGADDYLTKPFSSRELRARVRAHLDLVRTRRAVARQREEAAQLLAAVKARDEFLSVASHELRTPLSTLQLNLQVLGRLPRSAEELRAERLAVATRACKQMASLVDTLLDVGRLATGHLQLELAEIDLAEVVQELARRFEGQLNASGSSLVLKPGGPAVGRWDRLRIEQVLSNLLANAVKFGGGKPIELGYTVDPECVHVTVTDHGIGIAPEDQQRIFRRFEQAGTAQPYGGLGLGLWIANDIVKRHGGSIRVESKLGEGSTFTVDLPRAVPQPLSHEHTGPRGSH